MGKKVFKKGGLLGKIRGVLDPLKITQTFVDPMVDQFTGTDLTGAKAEAKDIADQNTQREVQAQTFAQNMSVDLGTENVANVDIGGTADAASTGNRRKKRQGGSSASSSLGINY